MADWLINFRKISCPGGEAPDLYKISISNVINSFSNDGKISGSGNFFASGKSSAKC